VLLTHEQLTSMAPPVSSSHSELRPQHHSQPRSSKMMAACNQHLVLQPQRQMGRRLLVPKRPKPGSTRALKDWWSSFVKTPPSGSSSRSRVALEEEIVEHDEFFEDDTTPAPPAKTASPPVPVHDENDYSMQYEEEEARAVITRARNRGILASSASTTLGLGGATPAKRDYLEARHVLLGVRIGAAHCACL
jgi:hypothetical protein